MNLSKMSVTDVAVVVQKGLAYYDAPTRDDLSESLRCADAVVKYLNKDNVEGGVSFLTAPEDFCTVVEAFRAKRRWKTLLSQ